MDNIWTRICDDISQYMEEICENYKLVCVKIAPLKVALIGTDFALIIAIDRFYAKVSYLLREIDGYELFLCDSYLAEKYDDSDRTDLIDGDGADIYIRNNLLIIASGLVNKWKNILSGDKSWIDDYKKSNRYSVGIMSQEELEKINAYMKD